MVTGASEQEPVGSLGVEAAKLLAALQDWAKDGGAEYVDAAAGAAAAAGATLRDLDEHLATGGADCTYCPLCRVIAAVRATSPEVRTHLRTAASALVEAAAGMLATTPPAPGHTHRATAQHDDGADGAGGDGDLDEEDDR